MVTGMNAGNFRRIALGMRGAVEGSHMGHPDFRIGRTIFASLHPDNKRGMVKLTPDQQRQFIREDPDGFVPENGAWGRQGCTAVRLDAVDQESLGEAITLAWQNVAGKKPAAPRRPPAHQRPSVTQRLPVTKRPAAAQRPSNVNSAGDLPTMLFKDQSAWRTWLTKYRGDSRGVWLRLAKKSASLHSVTYREALDVALCHGWIDGQKNKFDDASWLQKFTPRGPKSIWSKINRARALELIKSGKMRAPGLAAIERAKENGRWASAYDSHRTATTPPDFTAALKKNPAAKAFYSTLDSANRYAILFRIQTVKKASTRRNNIEQFVRMLAEGRKIHQ